MKDGYYWVKDFDNTPRIVEYESGFFWVFGNEREFDRSDFLEIGDYIEIPDKYKE